MSVSLLSISFNHKQPNKPGALHIRRNLTDAGPGDWQQGVSVKHEDSPAAYAIEDIRKQGNQIVVMVNFSGPQGTRVKIRTKSPPLIATPPTDLPGCLKAVGMVLDRFIKGLINVLGEIPGQWVDIKSDGFSGDIFFTLNNPLFLSTGVGLHYLTWQWQYSLNDKDWYNLETTRHQIYILLDIPTKPWLQPTSSAPDPKAAPWTEVMDYACLWAARARDAGTAAKMITKAINDLGYRPITRRKHSGPLEYNGGSQYALPDFHCMEFLDLLKGGPGLGKQVNCDDCAIIVSTFANILGCDLWQCFLALGRPMDGNNFRINDVMLIGSNTWTAPVDGWYYHRAAWYGSWGVNGQVFDACLKVDGDSDPTSLPHTPMLPADINFVDYIYRLAAPAQKQEKQLPVVTQQQGHERRDICLTPPKTKSP